MGKGSRFKVVLRRAGQVVGQLAPETGSKKDAIATAQPIADMVSKGVIVSVEPAKGRKGKRGRKRNLRMVDGELDQTGRKRNLYVTTDTGVRGMQRRNASEASISAAARGVIARAAVALQRAMLDDWPSWDVELERATDRAVDELAHIGDRTLEADDVQAALVAEYRRRVRNGATKRKRNRTGPRETGIVDWFYRHPQASVGEVMEEFSVTAGKARSLLETWHARSTRGSVATMQRLMAAAGRLRANPGAGSEPYTLTPEARMGWGDGMTGSAPHYTADAVYMHHYNAARAFREAKAKEATRKAKRTRKSNPKRGRSRLDRLAQAVLPLHPENVKRAYRLAQATGLAPDVDRALREAGLKPAKRNTPGGLDPHQAQVERELLQVVYDRSVQRNAIRNGAELGASYGQGKVWGQAWLRSLSKRKLISNGRTGYLLTPSGRAIIGR